MDHVSSSTYSGMRASVGKGNGFVANHRLDKRPWRETRGAAKNGFDRFLGKSPRGSASGTREDWGMR